MSDTTPSGIFVSVCDWQGRLIWTSRVGGCCEVGSPIWQGASPEHEEIVKAAIARVVTLREPQQIDAANHGGELFHVWLWPLNSPEIAVCLLSLQVPSDLSLLTDRERDCLKLLGGGHPPNEISIRLDVSPSTVHTHLKRAREKLGVGSFAALISYAARYCADDADAFGAVNLGATDERSVQHSGENTSI